MRGARAAADGVDLGHLSTAAATPHNIENTHTLSVLVAVLMLVVIIVVAVRLPRVHPQEDRRAVLLEPNEEPEPKRRPKKQLNIFVPLRNLGDLEPTVRLRYGGGVSMRGLRSVSGARDEQRRKEAGGCRTARERQRGEQRMGERASLPTSTAGQAHDEEGE